MKAFSRSMIFAILLVIPFLMTAGASATIHGVVYEWNTFQPLENVIVNVNSTPVQSMVCKYGTYSFELPEGNYKISASYYEDSSLIYYAEDFVNITDEGSYVLDLLLFPDYSQSASSINGSSSSNQSISSQNATAVQSNFIFIDTILITVLILLVLFFLLRHSTEKKTTLAGKRHQAGKQEKAGEKVILIPEPIQFTESPESIKTGSQELEETDPEETVPTEMIVAEPDNTTSTTLEAILKGPMPADLQEIVDIIRAHGGRMTQKDLRSKLKYSEGKVSLMLFDLEKRGMIQKFKRGRGNVILLVEQDQPS